MNGILYRASKLQIKWLTNMWIFEMEGLCFYGCLNNQKLTTPLKIGTIKFIQPHATQVLGHKFSFSIVKQKEKMFKKSAPVKKYFIESEKYCFYGKWTLVNWFYHKVTSYDTFFLPSSFFIKTSHEISSKYFSQITWYAYCINISATVLSLSSEFWYQ